MNPRPKRAAASGIIWSWSPPRRPKIHSDHFGDSARSVPVDLTSLLLPTSMVRSRLVTTEIAPAEVVAVALPAPQIPTKSFSFPALNDESATFDGHSLVDSCRASEVPAARPPKFASGGSRIRIQVPGDIIKLEDRLYYVLQPPLESWLSDLSLEFPCEPFPFQLEGVAFLYPRHAAVLADEMGLGKTMQAITALRLLLRAGEVSRVLLVCPKPLVANWSREFMRWAPEIPVVTIEGEQSRRHWQWRRSEMPVAIANYELLLRDESVITAPGLRFDLVILDESQRIKNRASRTSKVVQVISRKRSWALTGTPVENCADDLVGIFEFVAPGLLSSDMRPRRIGRAVSDHVLRRTKDQVLSDLPPKLFRDAELELTRRQRESYTLAEEQGLLRLNALGHSVTIRHVLELILRLKQICNFDPATDESTKLERLAADLEEVAASGQKAIVFSQWVQTLKALAHRLGRFSPLEFHGEVPPRQRAAVLERFQNDPHHHVVLMTYGTGGVGLNLQFASYVFLFDRWWNPAVEDQAINRAHRIGTAGPVTVTRFLVAGTIEERIDQILRDKRELFDTIFSTARAPANLGLSREELFGLFQLRGPDGKIDAA